MDELNKNLFPIQGAAPGGGGNEQTFRKPVEDPEGVDTTSGLVVSLTQIEVLDLLSEGKIEGLVSGEYLFSGRAGQIGYDSAIFSGYLEAPGTTSKFLRSIFWNEVPVVSVDNEFNFQQVSLKSTKGNPNGATSSEQLRDELTTSRPISERLRGGESNSKTYRVLNPFCKATLVNIRFGTLSKTNTSEAEYGDIEKTTVEYNIYFRPIFANRQPGNFTLATRESVTGKLTSGYIKSTRINFLTPTSEDYSQTETFQGWEIKITRLTEDSIQSSLRNQTFIDSLTEVYGETFIYPNSAIVASKFSAEYFQQIPNRAYDVKLLKVKVPSNYNTITRTYSPEPWDGTFKEEKEWTDNPVWCYYDLLTNRRYGLGKYVNEEFVDKWTLYEISKYCDTLVPDGYGGLEPRFSCNIILFSKEEAYNLLRNMASIFNAISYYNAGSIYLSQDKKEDNKDDFYLFTNTNVENGDFNYSTSSKKARHTVAIVRYNDKNNFYKPAVEYVEDVEGIKKYGIRELEISAFGTTTRGQALRQGRWSLLTENLNTETISFTTSLEANYLRPGDVFKVFDFNRKGERFAGRLNSININNTGSYAILDSLITGFDVNATYEFSLLTPTYNYDTSLVNITDSDETDKIRNDFIQRIYFSGNQTSEVNNKTLISFSTGFNNNSNVFNTGDFQISGKLVWAIESSGSNTGSIQDSQYEYYKILGIKENEGNKYEIVGLNYDDNKFAQIESGLAFQESDLANLPASPTGLLLFQQQLSENTKLINYQFSISDTSGVFNYFVYAKPDSDLVSSDISGNNYLIDILPTFVNSGTYIPLNNGTYYFRVYSANKLGSLSTNFASNNITITDINPIKDVIISSLVIDSGSNSGYNPFGSKETGVYDSASPPFKWQLGFNQSNVVPDEITYRITIRQPSASNAPNSNIYYEITGYTPETLSSPTYQFLLDTNITAVGSIDGKQGPFREYDIVVEAMTSGGFSSAGGNFITYGDSDFNNPQGYDILYVNNPRITGINLTTGNGLPSGMYVTEQWNTLDGDIKINFISGTKPDDIEGGFVYYSHIPFSYDNIISYVQNTNNNPKNIRTAEFVGNSNPVFVAPSFTGYEQSYIALSYYDTFDKALIDRGTNVKSDLFISNIVPIRRRGGTEGEALAFRNWVWVDKTSLSNWSKFSKNISNVKLFSNKGGVTTYEITFSQDLTTKNYFNLVQFNYTQNLPDIQIGGNLHLNSNGNNLLQTLEPGYTITRSTNSLLIAITENAQQRVWDRFFIGTLWNGFVT